MKPGETSNASYKTLLFWGGVFLLIIYGNTLQGQFVFDDWHNIVGRPELQLTRFTPETVINTFFTSDPEGKRLYRPVSCLSLAVNYYFGRHQVTGYHLVNIGIHLLTAYFLFHTLLLVINLAGSGFDRTERVFIAALATVLWAAHPIQTQAVSLVVQRMAAMAALFYILGLWLYIRFREKLQTSGGLRSLKWLAGSLVSFFCAVLSKENAIIFPVGLLLLELFFFQGFQRLKRRPVVTAGWACLLVLAVLVAGFALFGPGGPEKLITEYDFRPFTLEQRVLTEPRVLFFYLSQLFYPVPSRFSVEHYIPLSQGLFSPPATLFAFGGICLLLALGFIFGRRFPLFGFAVVFFFSHHLVESSVLPLALIYEHRNYLPSLFIFLPVAAILVYGFRVYQAQSRLVWAALFLFTTAIIFFLGLSTHIRNQDWQSDETLWISALRVAPEAVRPYLGLGLYYTREDSRDPDKALALFSLGVDDKKESYLIFEKAALWGEIAEILKDRRQWRQAEKAVKNSLAVYQAGLADHPGLIDRPETKENLAGIYFILAHLSSVSEPLKSIAYIDQAIGFQENVDYDIDKALYQNLAGNYQDGLKTLQGAIAKAPRRWDVLFALGHMLTFTGDYDRGYWFYRWALGLAQKDARGIDYRSIFLYMAENRRLAGHDRLSETLVRAYLRQASPADVAILINRHTTACPGRYPFVDTEITLRQIHHGLYRLADAIAG